MADNMQVELVAADRVVWSGEASLVIARTTEGEVGVLRDHAPLLSVLVPGVVEVVTVENQRQVAAVDGGFLSVANNHVSILAEHAELSDEIDLQAARQELERARAAGEDDEDAGAMVARAEARILAAEKAS
jgi:F-type H+-transporting ATPase subunit epsilon